MQHIPNDNFDAYLYDALSNAGTSPPPDMWARIEHELPDAADLALFGTLQDASAVVPEGIWDKIATQLDTNIALNTALDHEINDIFGALATYEVTPNADIWTRIEPVLPLEKIEDISFAALATYEVAPAADFWNRIEGVLDADSSEELGNDLQDFAALATAEIAPNNDFWDAIAARLEIEDEMQQFSALADYEVQPSADLWSRMELPAENTNVFTQFEALAEYEVTPQADNWNKIAARLEEEDDNVGMLINRLRHAEAEPAAQIWNRVSEDLPLNPALRRHLTNFSRIAAVLLVAFTASVFYDNYNHYNNSDTPIAKTGGQTDGAQLADNTVNTSPKITKTRRGGSKKGGNNNSDNENGLENNNLTDNNTFENNPSGNVNTKGVLSQNEQRNTIKKVETDNFAKIATVGKTFAKAEPEASTGNQNSVNNLVSNKNVNNSVSKSRKGQVINNFAPELPFPNTIPFSEPSVKNAVVENSSNNNPSIQQNNGRENATNIDAITSITPNSVAINNSVNLDSKILPPSRFMDAQMERLMLEEIAKSMPSMDMNNNLRLQFDDKTIMRGKAQLAEIDASKNIESFKNDNPVEDKIAYKGWSVGANAQVVLPSIYNNHILKTLTPVGGEVTQAISFRLGYGAAVGYQWTKRDGLGLEYNYTQQGQTYLRAANGKNTALVLNADYHHIAALYNHQVSLPTDKLALNFVVGPQIGLLNEASFKMEGDNEIRVSDIAKTDLGLVGGIDANYFLTRQTVISLGVRAAYARDLSRFATPDPLTNFTPALRLGVTYRLK